MGRAVVVHGEPSAPFIEHTALAGHPLSDTARLAAWIAQCHARVEQSTPMYIAHQLDFLGLVPAPPILRGA